MTYNPVSDVSSSYTNYYKEEGIFYENDIDEVLDKNSDPKEFFRSYRDSIIPFPERIHIAATASACGYTGDMAGLQTFIWKRLQKEGGSKGGPLGKDSLHNWLNNYDGKPMNSDHGRDMVFHLCFALGMNLKQTADFFQKAYMELPFQYRRMEETVYSFCLKNGLDFQDALEILDEVRRMSSESAETGININTQQIVDNVQLITDRHTLIEYLCSHRMAFTGTSLSGIKAVQKYRDRCKMDVLKTWQKDQEARGDFEDPTSNFKDISDPDLMTEIYGVRNRSVHYGGTMKFPKYLGTKKFLVQYTQLGYYKNDSLKIDKITYDTTRKFLILFIFYDFFSNLEDLDHPDESKYKEFLYETNENLRNYGYAELYIRNPYDWLIMHCASRQTKSPLDELRDIIEELFWQPANEQGHV